MKMPIPTYYCRNCGCTRAPCHCMEKPHGCGKPDWTAAILPKAELLVVLEDGGLVRVGGKYISGKWHRTQLGCAYFEDPGVFSTDVMTIDRLREKLADMYGNQSK